MKKNVIFSLITSLILSVLGLLINLICSVAFQFAPLAVTISGGDVIEHIGFGIDFMEIFTMTSQIESDGILRSVHFDLINFLVSFIAIFVVILIIKIIINKARKK